MMDDTRFDAWLRALAGVGSCRQILRTLTVGAIGLTVSSLGFGDVEGGNKKKKKKKKKKKRGTSPSPLPTGTSPPPPEGTSPPPPPAGTAPPPPPTGTPPPPLPTGLGRCDPDPAIVVDFGGSRRWAQTFLPPQGGQLTAAEFFLTQHPANFVLTIEIRTVDGNGAPTNVVLSDNTVIIAAEKPAGSPKKVNSTFSSPAAMTLGQPYALVITAPGDTYAIRTNSGNPCPDGTLFYDDNATEIYAETASGPADMVYALTITP